jgi:hypothetical protein
MNTKLRRLLVSLYFLTTGLGLSLLLSGTLLVIRSSAVTSSIPTTTLNGAQVPDWNQITFDSLPGIASSGNFQANSQIIQQLGYNPSRQWNQGQKPSSFLSLGDFQDTFKLQNLDLAQITKASGINTLSASLDKFGIMSKQSLDSLKKAVPNLGDFPVEQVLPVKDLITQSVGSFDATKTLNQLLAQSPQLGDISLANLDLSKYKVADIPNLDITQLGAFKDWQSVKIQDIPGLAKVPFSNFPDSPQINGQTVGTVDVVFGAAEHSRNRSISGSNKEGFGVPCDKGCGHIELSGGAILGRQWASGKYQEVKGGQGILGAVNGGKEPTGRHPFGEAFKVAIWDVSETNGTASMAMFFRICSRGTIDLGCTPYFLGPVPLMTFHEGDAIFLGKVTNEKSSNPSTPTSVALQEIQLAQNQLKVGGSQSGNGSNSNSGTANSSSTANSANNSNSANNTNSANSANSSSNTNSANSANSSSNSGGFTSNPSSPQQSSSSISSLLSPDANCKHEYSDVKLDALSSAFAAVESSGDYGAIGVFTCDKMGNCGRALGDKQFMSYRPDVRKFISSKSGGADFLKDLDSGKAISKEQVLQYFTPDEQRQLFNDDSQRLIDIASSQIDSTTGQPFSGDRLIERIAQMHFGGVAVPIDSNATDASGKSVQSYGVSVSNNYSQLVAEMSCN